MNIKMVVAYDGTHYCGFQRQRPEAGPSIQGCLEEAIARAVGRGVSITGAGRTDAGVHAENQVINVRMETSISPGRIPYAVNRFLPPDVVVKGAEEAEEGFHARFSARSKTYRYVIWREPFPSPFHRRYSWHRPGPLAVEAMRAGAAQLTGRRDFAGFQAAGRPATDTVREIMELRIEERASLLLIRVVADGFLYKMARNMVGTLMEIGRGRLSPETIPAIIAGRDRALAGPTAPARGLCLEKVCYG